MKYFLTGVSIFILTTLSNAQDTSDSLGFFSKDEAKNEMVNGLKEGKWVEWGSEDATNNFIVDASPTASKYSPYRMAIYRKGKLNGKVRICKNDGTLFRELIYVDGKKNGEAKWYYQHGQVRNMLHYVNDSVTGIEKVYYEDGKLESDIPFTDNKINGTLKWYYEYGLVKETVDFTNGELDGNVIMYYINGDKQRIDTYEKGKLKSGICYKPGDSVIPYFAKLPEGPPHAIYTVAPEMPKFPGDLNKWLISNIHYPAFEKNHTISGTVYLTFIVELDGSVSNVKVLRGVPNGPGLDGEAIRVISAMPKWVPGLQNSLNIRAQFNLPVHFDLI